MDWVEWNGNGQHWQESQADQGGNRGCSQPDRSSSQREHSPFGSREQPLKGQEPTDSCWTWANWNLQSKGSCRYSLKKGIKILHHCSAKASQRQQVNEWAWPCSNNTLFTKIRSGPELTFEPSFAQPCYIESFSGLAEVCVSVLSVLMPPIFLGQLRGALAGS